MNADRHIWRTESGELVEAGDPQARILAYAPGDEVSPEDAKKLGGQEKARTRPADKSRKQAEDK